MIYLAADHRGYALKEKVKSWLDEWTQPYEDLGAHSVNLEDDYPDFARVVTEKVAAGGLGILVCGSGVGMDISANRSKGIRCGLGLNEGQVQAAKRDDDINIISIAADFVSEKEAQRMIKTFLETEFSGIDRYKRRIEKLDK